jgi:hypothetical protein
MRHAVLLNNTPLPLSRGEFTVCSVRPSLPTGRQVLFCNRYERTLQALSTRHCDEHSEEAIPNYTGRIDRCTTCIAPLPIGGCFAIARNDGLVEFVPSVRLLFCNRYERTRYLKLPSWEGVRWVV